MKKISVFLVAASVFCCSFLLNFNKNQDGKWSFVAGAFANYSGGEGGEGEGGESGSGNNKAISDTDCTNSRGEPVSFSSDCIPRLFSSCIDNKCPRGTREIR